MKFQAKQGIEVNVEKLNSMKKEKLDNQLKEFMAKAAETQEEEKPAETNPESARQVVEEK